MNTFLSSNKLIYRLLRTIIQGIIGVLIANVDMLVGLCVFQPEQRAIVVALVMCILSPIMKILSGEEK